jgi:hypothetical protein
MAQVHRTHTLVPVLLLAALAACDQRQEALPTGPVPDTGAELQIVPAGAPTQPNSAVATATSFTSIRFSWTDAANDETYFEVARRVYNGAWAPWGPYVELSANTTSLANGGLTAGNSYHYRVRACNAAGCSLWSVSAPVLLPLVTAPTNVTASVTSRSSARVRWVDASNNEQWFQVKKRKFVGGIWDDWEPGSTVVPANSTSTDMTGLHPDGIYQFEVRSCIPVDCSAYVTSGNITMAPAAPQNLASMALTSTSVVLTWTDASDTETNFEVAWRVYSGAWSPWQTHVDWLGPNSTTLTVTGLAAGKAYHFRVRACNDTGCSPWNVAPQVRLPN